MKKITKILISLFASTMISLSAFAGELTVTGTAKATYNTVSGYANGDNTLGVTNEFTLGAAGELENGWTWTYGLNMDPEDTAAGGATLNDDSKLTLTTNFGTLAVFGSDGGLNVSGGFSANAYAWITDTAFAEGKVEPNNISDYMNMQYHTPAGLLPFGLQGKIAYAPSGSTNVKSGNQSNTTASATVGNMTMYQISATPIDGLSVSASYGTIDAGNGVTTNEQQDESGAIAVKYAAGPVTIGVSRSLDAPVLANFSGSQASTVEYYENNNFSIGFAVNESLSVSYSNESSSQNFVTPGTVGYDQDTQSFQAAYTMGGMTIALARTDYDNVGYVNNADVTETLLAVTMAF